MILTSIFIAVMLIVPAMPRAYAAEETYSCGAYGVNAYSENCEAEGKGGWLSDAGQRMLLYLLLSILLMSGGVAMYLKAKKSRQLPKPNR